MHVLDELGYASSEAKNPLYKVMLRLSFNQRFMSLGSTFLTGVSFDRLVATSTWSALVHRISWSSQWLFHYYAGVSLFRLVLVWPWVKTRPSEHPNPH